MMILQWILEKSDSEISDQLDDTMESKISYSTFEILGIESKFEFEKMRDMRQVTGYYQNLHRKSL